MAVFQEYSRYYNLLYKDKDYAAETAFVLGRMAEAGCNPQTLLDLGCGTGRHAIEMAQRGIAVTGVDMSETMLEIGRGLLLSDTPDVCPSLQHGDARKIRLEQTFDVVTSLFHVMSYQTTEDDALAVFATAKAHLNPGGLFLFDFWYGPGVLADPPVKRVRRLEDAYIKLVRTAMPAHRVCDNIVEVHYSIDMTDIATGNKRILSETHVMRYWFLTELRRLAHSSGFTVLHEGAWLSTATPDTSTWNAWMMVQA